jgi:hypothetical protein
MNASNSKIVKLFIEQKDDEFSSSSDVAWGPPCVGT